MELFRISTTSTEDDVELLYREITDELKHLHNHQDKVQLIFNVYGAKSEITCMTIHPDFQLGINDQMIYRTVAAAISEYIVSEREENIIKHIIEREYEELDMADTGRIGDYCIDILYPTRVEGQVKQAESTVARTRRKTKIAEQLQHYLEENTELNIDGFIHFRLPDYLNELRDVVEYAFDEYVMDKQYQEFISLLKYFVYIQEAKIPAAHLVHKGDHDFTLLDEQLAPIETKQLDSFVMEIVDKEINYEDMIVSTLITVSPQKVYIHTREPETQVIKSIQQIFEDRALLCTDCGMCRPILGENNQKGKLYP